MSINGDIFSLAEVQVFVPEIWSTEIFRYRLEQLILAQYCKRMSFMGRAGDLIRMPRISRLGVRPKVLKAPVEYQSITENEWSMTVNRYMESSFMIEDIVNIQTHTNLRSEYTREVGLALARDIDYRVMAERAAIIGADSTSHVVSTVPLAKADILAAVEILDRRRVPKDGRVLIITPAHYSSLLNIDEFINMDYVSNAPVETGEIGRVYGIPVVVDNNITINSLTGLKNGDNSPVLKPTPGLTGSDYFPDQEDGTVTSLTANYYSAMLLHSDCICLAMQQMPKTTSAFDIDYQANKVVSTQLYDVKLFRPDHGIVISTDEDGLI